MGNDLKTISISEGEAARKHLSGGHDINAITGEVHDDDGGCLYGATYAHGGGDMIVMFWALKYQEWCYIRIRFEMTPDGMGFILPDWDKAQIEVAKSDSEDGILLNKKQARGLPHADTEYLRKMLDFILNNDSRLNGWKDEARPTIQ